MCCRRRSTYLLSMLHCQFSTNANASCWHHFSTHQPENAAARGVEDQVEGRDAETDVHVSGVS